MTAMHYKVTEQYKLVNEQLKCLIEDVDYAITNYANASALFFNHWRISIGQDFIL